MNKSRHRTILNYTVYLVIFLLGLQVLAWFPAGAQSDDLQLGLDRDFGYASVGGSEIQGVFTLKARGPSDLSRVVFYIDNVEIGAVLQAPFELRFQTDNYPLGSHRIAAVGTTTAGRELQSNVITVNFVSSERGWQQGVKIIGPMLLLIAGAFVLSFVVTLTGSRKLQTLPPGTPRQYGVAGGAICPRCGRPYSRHLFAPNLLLGKLERCPFCGKWAIVAAASPQLLRQAEQNEIEEGQVVQIAMESEEERLRRELDDARYQEW